MVRQTGLTGTVEPCTPAERRGGTLAAPYDARGEGITSYVIEILSKTDLDPLT